MIRLDRVNAYYADSHVLQDVSFSLAPGDFGAPIDATIHTDAPGAPAYLTAMTRFPSA